MIRTGDKVQVVEIFETVFEDDVKYAKQFIGMQGVVIKVDESYIFPITIKFITGQILFFTEKELIKLNDDHWGEGV